MKKIIFTILFCLMTSSGLGADRYWIGNSGNWNDTAEWSETDGGSGGATVPGASDTAYVNANSLSATSTITINAAASVTNLIITGLDNNLNLTLSANLTCSGTCQIDGYNATTARILISSNSLTTARTISAGTVSISNADFRNITGAGAGSWDLSGATGGAGNCGGNTDITFTTADDLYWVGGTGNWSDGTNHWSTSSGGSPGARVPLPQDTAYIDNNSDSGDFTITVNVPLLPSIDTSGYTDASTFTFNFTSLSNEIFGSLDLSGADAGTMDKNLTFSGNGSYTLNMGGRDKTGGSMTFNLVGGTLTLASDLTHSTEGNGANVIHSYGTFDANDYNITIGSRFMSTNSNTRRIDMGSGIWTCGNGYSYGHAFDIGTSTNLTFNCETSTLRLGLNRYAGEGYGLNGSGKTFYTVVSYSGTGHTIAGSNTYTSLEVAAGKTLRFTDGTTQTVGSFTATGTSGSGITLRGSSTGGWTISDATGTNAVEYCTISYSTASGGATWNALTSAGNVDGGNNSGWDFGSATRRRMMIIQ